jgi:hypothetical protein
MARPCYRSEAGEQEQLVIGQGVAAEVSLLFCDAKDLGHVELHAGILRGRP